MNTIKMDSYDKAAFAKVKEDSPALKKLETTGSGQNAAFPPLLEDVYGSLYKYDPELMEEVEPGFAPNKTIMEQVMQMREYTELREYTCLQEFESAVGVQTFGDHIMKNLPKEMQDIMNEMAIVQTLVDGMMESYDPNNKNSNIPQNFKQGKEKLEALQQQMDQYLQKNEGKVRSVVRQAVKETVDDTKQVQCFMNSFGSEPGQLCKLPMKEKVKLAKKVMENPKLQKIAMMAGRFQRLALHYQSVKTKHGVDEIVDITCGNNLNRVVPTELVFLDDPDLDILFYDRYSQRKLLQFELEGKEQKGKGPIIICIDNSGSMSGNREVWAKAFALGLLTIARKQRRSFAIVHFGSKTELKSYEYPNSKVEPKDLLTALSDFYGGGTDFQTPLDHAIGLIEKMKSLKEADIIFVTDGECSVTDGFRNAYAKTKEELQFRVFGVLIETITDTLPFPTDDCFKLQNLDGDQLLIQQIYGKV